MKPRAACECVVCCVAPARCFSHRQHLRSRVATELDGVAGHQVVVLFISSKRQFRRAAYPRRDPKSRYTRRLGLKQVVGLHSLGLVAPCRPGQLAQTQV